MSIEAAENRISYCKMQIREYEERIRQLQKDIKELEALDARYTRAKEKFQLKNTENFQRLGSMSNIGSPLKSVDSYINSMRQLLSGSQYENALDGLSEAKRIVVKKVLGLEDEIKDLERKIDQCHFQIQKSHGEILVLRAKEAIDNV